MCACVVRVWCMCVFLRACMCVSLIVSHILHGLKTYPCFTIYAPFASCEYSLIWFTGHVSKSWQQFPIVTHLLLLATWHLLHKLDISHASVVTNQITLKVRLTWGTTETKSELSSKYATQSRPRSVAHTHKYDLANQMFISFNHSHSK